MRFGRDHLIFKALIALDEAATAGSKGPVRKTYALRFTLAFLFACSDGTKHPYEAFWNELDMDIDQTLGDYIRGTRLSGSLYAIIRSLQLPATPEFSESLRIARLPLAERRARAEAERRRRERADQIRAANGIETTADREKRRKRNCDLGK